MAQRGLGLRAYASALGRDFQSRNAASNDDCTDGEMSSGVSVPVCAIVARIC